jgi:hypothetical protein
MEKILIYWLETYTGVTNITEATEFSTLNFDLFDEAMTVDFIQKTFDKSVNRKIWYTKVGELLDDIS